MSKRGHVKSRPDWISRPTESREIPIPEPSTGSKRKSSTNTEPTSETNKRTRGLSATHGSNVSGLSNLVSVPEEAELEPAVLPARAPRNQSSVAEPSTPTTGKPKTGLGKSQPSPRPRLITPMVLSTSGTDHGCASLSDTGSLTRQPESRETQKSEGLQRSIDTNRTTQVDKSGMEELMRHELDGHVFEHKKFFEEFLESDPAIQNVVRQLILSSPEFTQTSFLDFDNDRWVIHRDIALQRKEEDVYIPLARMLNVVGRAAHTNYISRFPDDEFRQAYHSFLDHSKKQALWDYPSDAGTKPDLVKANCEDGEDGEDKRAHWGDVELLIECKSFDDTTSRNNAYLQLARYARTVFAHQVYRLRIFGFSLCGSIVNFVCFDRSGLLHSSDIDISTPDGAHSFVQHIITLLTIDAKEFGYDTRYSFRQNEEQNRVDTLFKFPGYDAQVVSEVLCYRKCCCGRATCVCALGDDVHKGIWRPKDRDDEGETLTLFKGVFGVCQVKTFNHSIYSTELRYPEALVRSPSAGFFCLHKSGEKTATCSSARSASAVSRPTPTAAVSRGIRVKSDILMPRGVSLFEAQSPLHLLMAIHDALMGIMAFTQAGKLHCDISAFNLLLVNPDKHYGERGWLNAPKVPLNPDIWNRTAKGINIVAEGTTTNNEEHSGQPTCPRLKRVEELNRGPMCVIHDTEFTVNEDRSENEVHTDRTNQGTPAFISAQLLEASSSKKAPTTRTFIHDVESLLWVLVWVVAKRSQSEKRWKINNVAKAVITGLSQSDMALLQDYKKSFLLASGHPGTFEAKIKGFENDWSDDLTDVICDLANYIWCYLYFEPSTRLRSSRRRPTEEEATHEEYTTRSRSNTFADLFGIFDDAIVALEAKYPPIDLQKLSQSCH
ncbi:hypothetical protein FRC12_005933 [Ceratobasidium sp. 428]|nr:hypothetical protein FRC12_005933 [Ceratobasidium sp. 428]